MVLSQFSVTVLSIIIIGLFILLLWKGYHNGFIVELMMFFNLIGAFVLTWLLTPTLITYLNDNSLNAYLLVIPVLFIVSYLLMRFIRKRLRFINNIKFIGFISKVLGLVIGAIKGFIIIALITVIVSLPIVKNSDYVLDVTRLRSVKNVLVKSNDDIFKMFCLFDEYRLK